MTYPTRKDLGRNHLASYKAGFVVPQRVSIEKVVPANYGPSA